MSTEEKLFKKYDGYTVAASELRLDPDNERMESDEEEDKWLYENIKKEGVKKPLIGYTKTEAGRKLFYVVDGSRRFKAIQKLLEEGIVIHVKFSPTASEKAKEQNIIDRLVLNEGKKFTVLEKAFSVGKLVKYNWSIADIAEAMSVTKTYVSKLHALYCGPKEIHNMIIAKALTGTLAIDIIENGDPYQVIHDYKAGIYTPPSEQSEQLTIEASDSQEEPKKEKPVKITKATLDSNKINSYKSFKKFASAPNFIPDRIPAEKRPIYDFMLKVMNNEVNELDFFKFFNED